MVTSVDWIYPVEQTHWWSKQKGAQMQLIVKFKEEFKENTEKKNNNEVIHFYSQKEKNACRVFAFSSQV